jgi:phage/plasmid-like protein (TIGR03299 family)
MSHEVEKMIFAGQTPWHGLGTPITEDMSFEKAFDESGLNFTVVKEPLYRNVNYATIEAEKEVEKEQAQTNSFEKFLSEFDSDLLTKTEPDYNEVQMYATVRTDTNAQLGIVGPRWTPLQNVDAFNVFEPLIESGDMTLHTAGSLRGGARIWVLCQLNVDNREIVRGDEVAAFALLSNGHDGKLAVHFGYTPIRVVCANTEAMARNSSESKLVRIIHHKSVKEKVNQLADLTRLANIEFENTAEVYKYLASKRFDKDSLDKYLRSALGIQPIQKDLETPLKTRSQNIKDAVEKLVYTGKGNDLKDVEGTWWAAYNGVTEYFNYVYGRNNGNRLDALWFGNSKNAIADALSKATLMADLC